MLAQDPPFWQTNCSHSLTSEIDIVAPFKEYFMTIAHSVIISGFSLTLKSAFHLRRLAGNIAGKLGNVYLRY